MALHQIHAPDPGFSGVVAGVSFVGGVGRTGRGTALAYFRRQGYGVERVEAASSDAPASEPSSEVAATVVPDGTIGEVVAWVRGADENSEPADGWHDRARQALEHELAKGDDARSRLVKLLNEVVG